MSRVLGLIWNASVLLSVLDALIWTQNIGSASYLLSQSNKFATESVGCRPQSESSLLVAGVVTMHYGLSLFQLRAPTLSHSRFGVCFRVRMPFY